MDLLPANYIWVAVRSMFGRSSSDAADRIREFFISSGFTPELSFSELTSPRLFIISADLNSGQPVIHGDDPDEKVLDGILQSTALPPWVKPIRKHERLLMDGGVVSNLPVEPAIRMGARQVVALDLMDTREMLQSPNEIVTFFDRLSMTVEKRQNDLELELARARGIPILYAGLVGDAPTAYWDFQRTDELMRRGHEIMCQVLEANPDLVRLFKQKPFSWPWQRQ
jgi:NTE family protein